MLHLVGETIDKARAHYQAERGKILQLMRGVYVDAEDDIDRIVLRHAIRIARYLYPRAYLSAASAILLAPTNDGRLFISGPRKQRTRIRDALTFDSVRLAPLYDAVTTKVFPGLENDRMALTLNGKNNRLRRTDFTKLATTAGVSATMTNAAIDHLLEGISKGLTEIAIPRVGGLDSGIISKAEKMKDLCRERISSFK